AVMPTKATTPTQIFRCIRLLLLKDHDSAAPSAPPNSGLCRRASTSLGLRRLPMPAPSRYPGRAATGAAEPEEQKTPQQIDSRLDGLARWRQPGPSAGSSTHSW